MIFIFLRYTALLPNPAKKGIEMSLRPRDIKAFDQDIGIDAPVYYTFNEMGSDYAFFRINRNTGKVSLAKDVKDNDLPYPAILVIRATQHDNPDRYALATLTVSKYIHAFLLTAFQYFFLNILDFYISHYQI